ncbi:tegument protein UL21 [Equid alphaherpesvirus 3]|uniref:Tegument protein UL21 n=1 Tax=Equid alphaherpesvirus 3 TaxID=80341 RepID=A0A077BCL7_9ALPH|nr:tegument protein UL21 [Equid alphaherpesvirus 3]AIL02958.1 tegument protein UL21 [Equid alphaherpesvirus 3]
MDFKYSDTAIHNGVVFYIADGGHRAYFIYGGCVLSVPRTHATSRSGEIAKFGLTVRGLTPGDRVVANYVRSELNRTGRHESTPSSEEDVFVDRLEVLAQGPRARGRDLCGSFDIEVYDPYLAECMVSLKVTSGLILSTGRDIPQEGILRLFDVPTIANAASGFVYTPNTACFALVQAYLAELPSELEALVDGLFHRIPAARQPLREDAARPGRTDVIVTSSRAAETMAIRPAHYAKRALRGTVVSDFVQVRLIPKPCEIWDSANRATSLGSLRALQLVFKVADEIILFEETWDGLDEYLNEARSTVADAVAAVYGLGENLPFFGGRLAQQGVTTLQRFVLCQFILAKWDLVNCYAALERLAESYANAYPEAHGRLPEADLVADAANELVRESGFLGEMCERLVRLDPPPLVSYKPLPEVVEIEAVWLAELAVSLAGAPRVPDLSGDATRRLEFEMGKVLGRLYAKEGIWAAAAASCKTFENGVPMAVAIETNLATAFDGSDACRKSAYYLHRLVSQRLKRGGVSVSVCRK